MQRAQRDVPVAKRKSLSSASKAPSNDKPYSVGYGRPPKHSRFRPGKSGNPKGRPPGHKNLRTILGNVFKERVELRQGDKIRLVTKAEALIQTLVNSELGKDHKAAATIVTLSRLTGHLDEEVNASDPIMQDAEAKAILQDYLARNPDLKTRRARPASKGRGRP